MGGGGVMGKGGGVSPEPTPLEPTMHVRILPF